MTQWLGWGVSTCSPCPDPTGLQTRGVSTRWLLPWGWPSPRLPPLPSPASSRGLQPNPWPPVPMPPPRQASPYPPTHGQAHASSPIFIFVCGQNARGRSRASPFVSLLLMFLLLLLLLRLFCCCCCCSVVYRPSSRCIENGPSSRCIEEMGEEGDGGEGEEKERRRDGW